MEKKRIYSKIIGTGSDSLDHYDLRLNKSFVGQKFFDSERKAINKTSAEVIKKFEDITGTKSRYYVKNGLQTSDIAIGASKNALASANISNDEIDCIIVANNCDASHDLVPSWASRIKHHLKIVNPNVIAYDIVVGGEYANHHSKLIKKYLGLGSHDMVIHVNGFDYDEDDLFGEADCISFENEIFGLSHEELSSIVVIHLLGAGTQSLADKVRCYLEISDPDVLAYDLIFGCPGFLQGIIQADTMIKSEFMQKVLVVGAEILSHASEDGDVDKLLYADNAGAVLLSSIESDHPVGVVAHVTRSDTFDHAYIIKMGSAYNPETDPRKLFLKMQGTRVHKYALNGVPALIKEILLKVGLSLKDVDEIDIHQPNPLMLIQRILPVTYAQFNLIPPKYVMPIIGDEYGNSSVSCLPLILDKSYKGELAKKLGPGAIRLLVSFGAGMNVVVVVYIEP